VRSANVLVRDDNSIVLIDLGRNISKRMMLLVAEDDVKVSVIAWIENRLIKFMSKCDTISFETICR
jgi:hypothetical protein